MTTDLKTNWKTALRRQLNSDWKIALAIVIGWKIIILIVGYFIDTYIGNHQGFPAYTGTWDGGWYQTVIADHYSSNAASAAFYPLFPLLVSFVQLISFDTVSMLFSGQIVSFFSVWAFIAALLAIGKILLGNSARYWFVALLLCAPAMFFAHMFYSEALFMALGFWAYAFALKRQWLWMGIFLAALTAVRLPAVLFIGLCALEYMRVHDWKLGRIFNKNCLYFLLAPVGFIAYGIYLLAVRGDFFAMFHAYSATNDWSYQVFDINILKTIAKITYQVARSIVGLRPFDGDIIVNHLIPLTCLIALIVGSIWLLWKERGKFVPLGIMGLLATIMFTLNGNVVSVHRYVLPCLGVYVAFYLMAKKRKYQRTILMGICSIGAITQLYLMTAFISGHFAG